MILRELLAVFGLQFDDKGMRQADRGLKRLQKDAEALSGIFTTALAGAAAVAPFVAISKLASDATEDLNLLGVTFQENAETVVAWSNDQATALGRSRFELRKFAGNLGLVFRGMDVTTKEAAKMSTELSALAVDYSSLSNFKEADVLGAFRSGLTGETESLKRLGIVMNEAALKNFALSKGIGKSVKAMSSAEKATLRYQFLMEKASIAAGDAAKTGFQLAGAMRRVRGILLDLATSAGLKFLPVAERIVNGAAELLTGFRDLAEGTHILEGALVALGIVAAAALLPLLSFLPVLLAFALFAIVLDEIITTFKGGDSVLSDFVDLLNEVDAGTFLDIPPALQGILEVVNKVRDGFGRLMLLISSGIQGLITGDLSLFEAAWDDLWGDIFQKAEDDFNAWVAVNKAILTGAVQDVKRWGQDIASAASEALGAILDGFAQWSDDADASILQGLQRSLAAFKAWAQGLADAADLGLQEVLDAIRVWAQSVGDSLAGVFTSAVDFWRKELEAFIAWFRRSPVGRGLVAAGVLPQEAMRRGGEFVGVRQQEAAAGAGAPFRSVPQTAAAQGIGPGASMRPQVMVQQGSVEFNMELHHEGTESGEDLLLRARDMVQGVLEDRDQAMLEGLVQRAQ